MGKLRVFFAAGVLLLSMHVAAFAEKRVALVIGNDNYENVPPLQKATNDASAIADTLSQLGFEVIVSKNATRREMNRSLQEFSATVSPGDVALFYYAGHAIEIAGENFLLPIDIPRAEPGQEEFIRSEAVGLNRILAGLRSSSARLNIAILDSCRNNPFAGTSGRGIGGSRGLARIVAPTGTFIMYSADAGEEALDTLSDEDPDPNSVFTRTLIPLMVQPGLDLADLAREVRRDVHKLAGTVSHQQTPAYYDAILGNFEFRAANAVLAPVVIKPAALAPENINRDYLSAERIGSQAAWDVFLLRYGHLTDNFHVQLAQAALQKFPGQNPPAQLSPQTPSITTTPAIAAPSPSAVITRSAPAEQECDRLAADPIDKHAVAKGVADGDLSASSAVNACRQAIGDFPKTARFAHQLARSLEISGNYTETHKWYRQASAAGYTASMVNLGQVLSQGNIGPRDYAEAQRLFRQAAELGDGEGMNGLGKMFEDGQAGPKDPKEAARWYLKSAESGNLNGMHSLGQAYYNGTGVAKDHATASRWFRQAADAGLGASMYSVGFLYFHGEGVIKNRSEAAYWFARAGEKGSPEAMGYLGIVYHSGLGVKRDQLQAAQWTARALKNGYDFSLTQMTTNARAYNKEFRKHLQRILRDDGFYSGPIDGAFGPGTRRAIETYFKSALRQASN